MEEHPTAIHIAAFVEGKLERQQARLVVVHLLRGCPNCRKTANEILARGRSLPDNAYETAFAAVQKSQKTAAAPRGKRSRALLRFPTAVPAG